MFIRELNIEELNLISGGGNAEGYEPVKIPWNGENHAAGDDVICLFRSDLLYEGYDYGFCW